MLSSTSHFITKFLGDQYPQDFVAFKIVPYKGDISAFFFDFANTTSLENEWNKISGYVAGYYQSEIADVFTKWNIYVFYFCREPVPLSLKYKIENDRFSSRKVVIGSMDKEIDELALNDFINEHITNRDIRYESGQDAVRLGDTPYVSDSVVAELIRDVQLKSGKGNTEETAKILTQITARLKDENKKS